MQPVIEVKDLRKEYRSFERRPGIAGSFKDLFWRNYKWVNAVDGITFSVKEGELLGYIGPNGAGKSTSIKMLTGILQPSSGVLNVFGFEPFRDRKQYARHIGVVFGQRTQLWWDIAVRESFQLLGKIYEVPPAEFKQRLAHLTEILDLERFMGTPVRKLSLGERMRCDLTASLLHNPRVLFLDEPTIGLDAVAKERIRVFLREVNRDFGTTILLTTHDLKEIEELCDRIIVLDKGKVVYDGALDKIKALPGLERDAVVDFSTELAAEKLQSVFGDAARFEQESARRIRVRFDPQRLGTAELVRKLFADFSVADLTIAEPSIDEVIMKIYRDGVQTP